MGEEIVWRKGRSGRSGARGALSRPESVRAGLGEDARLLFGGGDSQRGRVPGAGSPEPRVRGEEGVGLRWRGRGGAPRLALAAIPPERREARSARAWAPAAGLGGGAGTLAAGFPPR